MRKKWENHSDENIPCSDRANLIAKRKAEGWELVYSNETGAPGYRSHHFKRRINHGADHAVHHA